MSTPMDRRTAWIEPAEGLSESGFSSSLLHQVRLYISLAKLRITVMVTLTGATGYYLALGEVDSWSRFLLTLIGTGLSSSGAGALNNYLERDSDRFMERTAGRPLPSGKLSPNQGLLFGVLLVLIGTSLLAVRVNLLSGFLALLSAFLYVLVYTPLKRVTWLNTLVGAIPGALPPVGGWAAATGEIGAGAWVLFAIMFLWQHPHFYAIAWMYRDDYKRAGLKMLPVVKPDGRAMFDQIVFFSALLIIVSVLPTVMGINGILYFAGAILLGAALLLCGMRLANDPSIAGARSLMRLSLLYLPLLFILIVIDRV